MSISWMDGVAWGIWGMGAFVAFLFSRSSSIATGTGCVAVCAGALAALAGWGARLTFPPCEVAGFFQLPILVLAVAGAIHSLGYLKGHGEKRAGTYWGFYNITVAAMYGVTLAGSPFQFLVLWELMGLASFALVAFERESKEVMRAAWIYIVACHAGAAFLIAMFFFGGTPTAVFVLGVIGFGLKIGFPLLHVWLPEAHPAAPAPVSALMSGAMIQLGFYGLLTYCTWSLSEYALYGWTLLGLGVIGTFGGMLFALGQTNLKKLLAYSSIENMGVMAIGFGFGFLGSASGNAGMSLFGFAGAFLHLLIHALLKGGLFLGAGSILRAEGTLEMDRMGGLLKRAPFTGWVFAMNAAGLSGLPPFAGFLSEFLIYLAALAGLTAPGHYGVFAMSLAVLIVLALTGGLAASAYVKAVGAVFLGEPRSPEAAEAHEVTASMKWVPGALLILSALLTAGASWVIEYGFPAYCGNTAGREMAVCIAALRYVGVFSGLLILLAAIGLVWRFRLVPRSRRGRVAPTWDCGYRNPSARMEYTGTAFTQPLTDFFAGVLRPRVAEEKPEGDFPRKSSFEEWIEDGGVRFLWQPVFRALAYLAHRIHVLQSGYLHLYILAMVLTLLAMLLWAFLFSAGMEGGF